MYGVLFTILFLLGSVYYVLVYVKKSKETRSLANEGKIYSLLQKDSLRSLFKKQIVFTLLMPLIFIVIIVIVALIGSKLHTDIKNAYYYIEFKDGSSVEAKNILRYNDIFIEYEDMEGNVVTREYSKYSKELSEKKDRE